MRYYRVVMLNLSIGGVHRVDMEIGPEVMSSEHWSGAKEAIDGHEPKWQNPAPCFIPGSDNLPIHSGSRFYVLLLVVSGAGLNSTVAARPTPPLAVVVKSTECRSEIRVACRVPGPKV